MAPLSRLVRRLPYALLVLWLLSSLPETVADGQSPLIDPLRFKEACPEYVGYSKRRHDPPSEGPLKLPFQRPSKHCRTFSSSLVEKVIDDLSGKMLDKDLARIFENAFPNTLDTTVRWHVDAGKDDEEEDDDGSEPWRGAQSFIVTGDINAEWLRDSTNQLAQYQILARKDRAIANLILGAINTQAEYVVTAPYCNAFQPPRPSRLQPVHNGFGDSVHPVYEPSVVFECKYELDSLASFLALGNQYHAHSKNKDFLTPRWFRALSTLLEVVEQQSRGTFNADGKFVRNEYRWQRSTNQGTETLNLDGVGNPLAAGTGLVRSAFRPSDDATILGFLIPANAMLAVELKRTSVILAEAGGHADTAEELARLAERVRAGVWEHGVVPHKKYGDVFAFEVDGYGSQILMDDANLPSLLALPLLGFVERDDKTYLNTRRMILDKLGNPYYLEGREFRGIGGPHVGLEHAWPMAVLVQAMTSDDDAEIARCLELVRDASHLGLVHETINVRFNRDYTRPWFAWANSVFAQTIIDLAQRKPHLLFGPDTAPYVVE